MNGDLKRHYYESGYWRSEDLWASFLAVAQRDLSAVAFVDAGRSISFGGLIVAARRFGEVARSRGYQDGDVLVIHGRHCIEAAVAILGCAYANLIAAILPPMFSSRQIGEILASTRARAIVGLGEPAEIERVIEAARAQQLQTIVVADGFAAANEVISWSDFADATTFETRTGSDVTVAVRKAQSPDVPSLLIFSSGTTGAPKGVIHSTNTLRYAVEAYSGLQHIGPSDTSLVVCAFGFVGSSILGIYLSFLTGCRTVLLRTWDVDQALSLIETHAVTHFLLMPTHALDILSSPKLNSTDCSSLTRGVVAGIDEAHRLDVRSRLCAMPFPMYGMSESPAHVTGSMSDEWDSLRTSEGRCLPGAEVLICDENGHPLPAGQPGNILVRGPNRFLGYYRAETMTAEAITAEGYFRTGDIGSVDSNGFMTFVGRNKDIIRRGGVTIVPSEIETVLRTHPRVADVAVIALPDARFGERACACVITRDSQDLTLAEVTQYLQSRELARYLWPEMVQRCESFPRTPSLKVQKNELRSQIIEKLGIG